MDFFLKSHSFKKKNLWTNERAIFSHLHTVIISANVREIQIKMAKQN